MDIIYGGTFDPPHKGHERFLDLMTARFPDARIHLLPCYQSVHKGRSQATAEQRVDMLRLLAQGRPRVRVNTRELDAGMPVYSVDTLAAWRQEVGPEVALVFAMGGDSLARLHSWSRWQTLLELVHILVLPRPGYDGALAPVIRDYLQHRWLGPVELTQLARTPCGRIMNLPGKPLPWASSQIRHGDANKARALPPPVLKYVESHALYATS